MSDKPEAGMPLWALPTLSWVVSLYFLLAFAINVGYPPTHNLPTGDVVYLFLWLLFLFLPFFSRIKIAHVLELEREVAKAKEELREFKTEVRNSMSVLSTNVNTVGRMTNQVLVNIPGLPELREARAIVDQNVPLATRQTAEKVEERILDQSEDSTLALAKTRIDIERLLRTILGKKTSVSQGEEDTVKFASITRLFDTFLAKYPKFEYLKKPFRYVIQVCNAAIHAQRVTDEQSEEALGLGAQIIAVLKELEGDG